MAAAGGNKRYPRINPEDVPEYNGPEKVPICWQARTFGGEYDRALSVQLAVGMVAAYGINLEHGPACPSNHSQRIALDMAISWSGEKLVVPYCPEVGPSNGKQAAVIDGFPRNDQNPGLWRLGRTYGVFKYAKREDPQHWSQSGH